MTAYTVGMCKRLGLAFLATAIAAAFCFAFPTIWWVFLIGQGLALFLISWLIA